MPNVLLEAAMADRASGAPRSETSGEPALPRIPVPPPTPRATTPPPNPGTTRGNAPSSTGNTRASANTAPTRPRVLNKGVGGDAIFKIRPVNPKYGPGVELELLPARQSFTPGQGQRIPGAGAGLTISTRSNIARIPIPSSRPIYQHMGILEETVSFVGAFVGFDLPSPGDKILYSPGKTRSQTAYEDALNFLEAVRPGFEVVLEMKTVASDGSVMDILFSDDINPADPRERKSVSFKGFIRNFQQEVATAQRVYYRVEMVITNREQKILKSDQSPAPPKAPPVPAPPKPISNRATPSNIDPAVSQQRLSGLGLAQTTPTSSGGFEIFTHSADNHPARQFELRYDLQSPNSKETVAFQNYEYTGGAGGPAIQGSGVAIKPPSNANTINFGAYTGHIVYIGGGINARRSSNTNFIKTLLLTTTSLSVTYLNTETGLLFSETVTLTGGLYDVLLTRLKAAITSAGFRSHGRNQQVRDS